jgi:hypothetical protein
LLQVDRGIEFLIVINPELARCRFDEQAAVAWTREDGVGVRHHDEGAEAAALDDIEAAGEAVDLRVIPGNREHQRRIEQHAKVVGIRGAFYEITDIHDRPLA